MMAQQRLNCAPAIATVFVTVMVATSCARALNPPLDQPAPTAVSQLWRAPDDLESRDLFHGSGGPDLRPQSTTFTFVAHKTSGTNKGYDVRDDQGRVWAVKLGTEAQPEVTVSRILWALGFHQPPAYYIEQWQLTGGDRREQPAARFRPAIEGREVDDDWSWYDNPFIGSRPFAALVTVNMLLNNWDLKTANNKIYLGVDDTGATVRHYVVRDLGGSLGRAQQPRPLTWLPFMRKMQGTKNNLEHFEGQGFVRGVEDDRVAFDYSGLDGALVNSVSVEDLRWTCALLSRLSEAQWTDAFRAGGYSTADASRYVRKIQAKIAEAQRLVDAAAPAAVADATRAARQ
jgi:hypothetical protein